MIWAVVKREASVNAADSGKHPAHINAMARVGAGRAVAPACAQLAHTTAVPFLKRPFNWPFLQRSQSVNYAPQLGAPHVGSSCRHCLRAAACSAVFAHFRQRRSVADLSRACDRVLSQSSWPSPRRSLHIDLPPGTSATAAPRGAKKVRGWFLGQFATPGALKQRCPKNARPSQKRTDRLKQARQ